jgi:hypothetical protein
MAAVGVRSVKDGLPVGVKSPGRSILNKAIQIKIGFLSERISVEPPLQIRFVAGVRP